MRFCLRKGQRELQKDSAIGKPWRNFAGSAGMPGDFKLIAGITAILVALWVTRKDCKEDITHV